MATDQFTAVPTSPRLLLAIKELLKPIGFNENQILNHAHPVKRLVPPVNGF